MLTKSEILTISAAGLITIVLIGCHSSSWVDKIGPDMDKLAKGYEKFGTVTMSSPILVEAKSEPNGGDYFDFNLSTGPNEYYKDALAKVQGQSAIFNQYVKTSGFGLEAQADIPALMGYIASLHEYAQTLSEYQAQKTYLSQAREFEAQKVIAELPQNASAATIREAMAKAAKIRAGDPNKPLSYPTYPIPPSYNPPSIKNVAPDANRAEKGLYAGGFKDYLGLLSGGTAPSISNRSAITTAAGDTVTEGVFRLLGNPAEAMKFKDKIIMFGVSMVSVNPGWLTNKNYTAELSVSCDYSYRPARKELLIQLLENEKNKKDANEKDADVNNLIKCTIDKTPINESEAKNIIPKRLRKEVREIYTPLSTAVSPMTDVDSLDLGSSQRLQISDAMSIAASLSSVGLKASAAYFREWAKRREQDVHTRTSYAAVTAFSDGGFFGWRIKPRLQALENPSSFDSKPANVLEQQAFPVVVIVGIDRDDLQLGFTVESGTDGNSRIAAYEPMICFRQTVSWLPNNSRERLSETERLNWAYSYIKAKNNLKKFDKKEEKAAPVTADIKPGLGSGNRVFASKGIKPGLDSENETQATKGIKPRLASENEVYATEAIKPGLDSENEPQTTKGIKPGLDSGNETQATKGIKPRLASENEVYATEAIKPGLDSGNETQVTKGIKPGLGPENAKSDEENIGDKEIVKFIGNRIVLLRYHTLDSWNEQYIPIELFINQAPADKKAPNPKEYEPLFNLWRQKKIPNK
jgi:hypothetical protein